ncbi:cilia- and flagella-associated protein 68 [Cyrtonyx montezumae]|uniref:cilia- and flagella-associated protein 68 n=1 Tax=Cyrtonyx montezumae TaxID=9017 RepID=UPI0032DA79E1
MFNFFSSSLKYATGHGELWTETSKFSQYGWRYTTNENDYSHKVLMGNWNEERYDIQNIAQPKPLLSQYAHCFETTYSLDYNKAKHQRRRFDQEPLWFPGHQPELEPPLFKSTAQSKIDYWPSYNNCSCPALRERTRRMQKKQ